MLILKDAEHLPHESNAHLGAKPTFNNIFVKYLGTTTNGRALIQFKSGAFLPQVPVQPVCVRLCGYAHFTLSWVAAGPGLGELALRVLSEPINVIKVLYLPPVSPPVSPQGSPQTMAHHVYRDSVRRLMARALEVPVTEHSFDDVRLQTKALKAHMDPEDAVLEFGKFKQVFGGQLDVRGVAEHMKDFVTLDMNHSGSISRGEFLKFFPQENEVLISHLFDLLDEDGSGGLSFREYLLGLAMVTEQGHPNSSAERKQDPAVDETVRATHVGSGGLNIDKKQQSVINLGFRMYLYPHPPSTPLS